MAKRQKRGKREDQSYLAAAKELAKYAPSLRKYGRRKRLSPAEKAAIARKENLIKTTAGLFPLTEKQVKKLADKSAIVGNGIRAVRLSNTTRDTKIAIKDGNIITKQRLTDGTSRNISYVSVPPLLDLLIEKAEEIFAQHSDKVVTVWLWVKTGRAAGGYRSLRLLLQKLQENWIAYALDDERFRGFAVLIEN